LRVAEGFVLACAGDETPRRSVAFVAFSAEEHGLWGSHQFAQDFERQDAAIDDSQVVAMINLDMVGNLTDGRLRVWGAGSGKGLSRVVREANDGLGLRLRVNDERGPRSDHWSFHRASVPAVLLITDAHDRYHTPRDTPEHVNVAGVVEVARYAERLVEALVTMEQAPAFRAGYYE